MQATKQPGGSPTHKVLPVQDWLTINELKQAPVTVCRLHLARADVEHDASQWVRQTSGPSSPGNHRSHASGDMTAYVPQSGRRYQAFQSCANALTVPQRAAQINAQM